MLRVHLATDGDSASITPKPGRERDRFLESLEPLVRDVARLERGPTESISDDAGVLVGSRIPRDLLASRPRLRTIIVPWAGIPRSLPKVIEESGRSDVVLRNIHHNAALSLIHI